MPRRTAPLRCLPLLVFAFVLWTGWVGIDFGKHWDEWRLLESVEHAMTSGVLLPGWYDYGAASFNTAVAAMGPEAVRVALDQSTPTRTEKQAQLGAAARTLGYRLTVRRIFLFLTHLTFLPIGILVYRWRQSVLEAVVASCLFLSLWEVQYHARWIAPDGLMMMWSTVALGCVVTAVREPGRSRSWLRLGAVATGFAIASKYPAGIMFVPLLVACRLVWGSGRELRREMLRLTGIVFVAFVVVTPGILIEPARFVSTVAYQVYHYGVKGHGAHTVDPLVEHMGRILQYLGSVAFSSSPWVALACSALVSVGIYDLVRREDRRVALVFLLFPVLYVLYFSAQKVMIVRNLLVVLPFMAILAARGVGCIVARLPSWRYRAVAVVLTAVAILYNLSVLYESAASVSYSAASDARQVAAYLERHASDRVFASPGVRSLFANASGLFTPAGSLDEADLMLFRANEVVDVNRWIVNRPGVYEIVAGSREVNWDYYPSWAGETPILCVGVRDARMLLPAMGEPDTSAAGAE
jgi:4-amino-4-deoxy-L-arabinose transferase-like glycosyltransferase